MATRNSARYVTGVLSSAATFGSTGINTPGGDRDPSAGVYSCFVAGLGAVALPTVPGSAVLARPTLYPTPTLGAAALVGLTLGAAVRVLDALGRVVATATADATGPAQLGALPAGLYLVRTNGGTVRLAVK